MQRIDMKRIMIIAVVMVHLAGKLHVKIVGRLVPVGETTIGKTVADERGHFSYTFTFPVVMEGVQAYFIVWAVDEQNNRSIPDTVLVLWEHEKDEEKQGKNTGEDAEK